MVQLKSLFATLIFAVVLFPREAVADSNYHVTADQAGSKSSVAPSSGMVTRTGGTSMVLRIYNSCFPTNLRAVANPLANNALITAYIDLAIGSSLIHIKTIYPAQTATAAGASSASFVNTDPNDLLLIQGYMAGSTDRFNDGKAITDYAPTKAYYVTADPASSSVLGSLRVGSYGNTVQAGFPAVSQATINSNVTVTSQNVGKASIARYAFFQKVLDCKTMATNPAHPNLVSYGCQQFMGSTGVLSTSISGINVSSDNSSVEISAAFPGQTGFCGGYWSPLMLFFSEKRPAFSGESSFMMDGGGHTAWPEANSPGYFLVYDRDKNGKITRSDQLFGDQHGKKNGFDALRQLDSNHDDMITQADAEFSKLLLWQDKNGDGIAQPEELSTLKSKGITTLSLKYEDVERSLGRAAEERGVSEFRYTNSKGRRAVGKIVDIWLRPVESIRVPASIPEQNR